MNAHLQPSGSAYFLEAAKPEVQSRLKTGAPKISVTMMNEAKATKGTKSRK